MPSYVARTLVLIGIGVVLFSGRPKTNADDPPERRSEPRKVLLDTDPGGDDVFAMLWLQSLAKQGLVEIVAVTTASGNVNGEYTFANASRTLTLGGFDEVEVGRGVSVAEPKNDAAYIHGSDGMGGLSQRLPEPRHRLREARYSDEIILDRLNAAPGQITLIAIGPLTNLAAAEDNSPGVLAKAREVIVMGGAFRREGNVTPKAEFNIGYDPQAAATVFASRKDIVVLPLDVTQQMTFREDLARDLRRAAPNSHVARFVDDLCRSLTKAAMGYRETNGVRGFHVHDAATLAYLCYPETLLFRRAHVRIETQGQWTRGQTVFDDRHVAKTMANAWVAVQVDAVNVLAILAEDLNVLIDSNDR